MRRGAERRAAGAGAGAVLAVLAAAAAAPAAAADRVPEARVVAAPSPVTATDGARHVVYEIPDFAAPRVQPVAPPRARSSRLPLDGDIIASAGGPSTAG